MVWFTGRQGRIAQVFVNAHSSLKSVAGTGVDARGTAENVEKLPTYEGRYGQ